MAPSLRRRVGWLAGGLVALASWPAVHLAWLAAGGSGPVGREAQTDAVLDLDARVATRALPRCRAEAASVRVLHEAGAGPRVAPDGGSLWFDADHEGQRQVFRMTLPEGVVRCWTCDEPGHNTRPDPGGVAIVFESDRDGDPELHLMRARGAEPDEPSRRLTRAAGPDDHPLLAPGGGRVVWSRRGERGFEVVAASLISAHGAILLGTPVTLARGGAGWVAPVAWSPDARALVLASGNPFAPSRALAVDFAGDDRVLAQALARGGAAFSADGGVVALATTAPDHAAAFLPEALTSWLAERATHAERHGRLHRGTRLLVGETGAEPTPLPLPEVERFGAPTGVTLSPDGTTLYLGQRASDGAERLLEIRRDCDG